MLRLPCAADVLRLQCEQRGGRGCTCGKRRMPSAAEEATWGGGLLTNWRGSRSVKVHTSGWAIGMVDDGIFSRPNRTQLGGGGRRDCRGLRGVWSWGLSAVLCHAMPSSNDPNGFWGVLVQEGQKWCHGFMDPTRPSGAASHASAYHWKGLRTYLCRSLVAPFCPGYLVHQPSSTNRPKCMFLLATAVISRERRFGGTPLT